MNFVQYLVTNEKMKLYSEMHSYGNNNLAQVYFHPQLPCATACYYFPIHISILLLHISSLYFPRIINDIRIRSPSFCILNNITNNIRPPYSIILLPIYHLFHNFFKFSIIYLNRKLAKIKKKTLKFYKTKEKFISTCIYSKLSIFLAYWEAPIIYTIWKPHCVVRLIVETVEMTKSKK